MAQVDAGLAVVSRYRLKEQVGDPPNPAGGYGYLYCKPEGVFFKDDNGEVVGPFGFGIVPGGRLTLETGVPVSTTDQSAKTALFYTPYKHDIISLYSNSKWNPVQFTEKTITVIGLTASRVYDVFGYLNAGTLALELLIWTDGTTRATNIVYQDGRLVKSGNATRRYLGTICINATGGQTEDTVTQRFVWNYYNRVNKNLFKEDNNLHTYNALWRAWNNDVTVRVELILGVAEDAINMSCFGRLELGSDEDGMIGFGLDTVADSVGRAFIRGITYGFASHSLAFKTGIGMSKIVAEGYHYVQLIEQSGGSTTVEYTDGGLCVTALM